MRSRRTFSISQNRFGHLILNPAVAARLQQAPVVQTIAFCGLLERASGPQNFMKNRSVPEVPFAEWPLLGEPLFFVDFRWLFDPLTCAAGTRSSHPEGVSAEQLELAVDNRLSGGSKVPTCWI